MVFAYVTLHPTLDRTDTGGSRIYALLLPSAQSGRWEDVAIRQSKIHDAGFGVFPAPSALHWPELRHPVVLPYLGLETVVKDQHTLKLLILVLRGEFVQLTAGEVMGACDDPLVADGLFAVPQRLAPAGKRMRPPLPASTELLQVAHPEAANRCRGGVQDITSGTSSVCYLLADDARQALHLHGDNSHLFDLLCAHGRYEHSDRHLATHVATLHRREEGHVLINGHPAFLDGVALTAIINEPAAQAGACLKMLQSYARLLDEDHPLMLRAGLRQPAGAVLAWQETMRPPEGGQAPSGYSERMVLYASTRKNYGLQQELTVDYGKSYIRHYGSGAHRPVKAEAPSPPPEKLETKQLTQPRFPELPGWFNPKRQPARRPAFRCEDVAHTAAPAAARGQPATRVGAARILVCADDPALVTARRLALGLPARDDGDDAGSCTGSTSADTSIETVMTPRRAREASAPSPTLSTKGESREMTTPSRVPSQLSPAGAASIADVAERAKGVKRAQAGPLAGPGTAGNLDTFFARKRLRSAVGGS